MVFYAFSPFSSFFSSQMPPRSSATHRRSLGYFVSVTDNGAHEDAAQELFIVSANLFYHEHKRFLS